MAKSLFHKNQRVYVKPVGTWAHIERVIPHWVKDVAEPLRVTYDVGLGRDFLAGELISEASMRKRDLQTAEGTDLKLENWRIFRARNKWADGEAQANHPIPGTFPVVVTDDKDWGGWRVPGAEYDRDPGRIEHQARIIANAPDMLGVIKRFADFASTKPGDTPDDLIDDLKAAAAILRSVYDVPVEDVVAAE
ncbi:MAG: hypothetical protein AAFQ21_04380 [Pseudomonadota bacterium]